MTIGAGLSELSIIERTGISAGVLLVLFALFLAFRWAGKRASQRRGRQATRLIFLASAIVFLLVLAGGSGLLVLVWDVEQQVYDQLIQQGNPIRIAGQLLMTFAFLVIVYVVSNVVQQTVEKLLSHREDISDHEAEIAFRVIQITIYIGAFLIVLSFWDVPIGNLLIGAGFAGIVLGMAARQTLGALLAGFVLMFSRPFEIGDWIQVDDKEGVVTDITIVNTRMQTFDGEYVILPNDMVGSSEVVNRSRKGRLRLHVEVGVDYEADLEHAIEVAGDAMKEVDDILSVPRPQVVLKEFGGSSIVLDLRFWIDKPSARRKWRAQTAVVAAVKKAFDEEGVKIPFPQRELSGREETGGFRIADEAPEVDLRADASKEGHGQPADRAVPSDSSERDEESEESAASPEDDD